MAHNVKGTDANGNDKWMIEGEIEVQSGGVIDIESGASLKIAGTAVTSTAAELNVLHGIPSTLTSAELAILDGVTATKNEINILDGQAASATITLGDEDGGVRTVTIQLKDGNGANVAAATGLRCYLATAATGQELGAISAAGMAIASAGKGLFIANGSSKIDGTLVSDATGLINAQITGDAGETYYLILILPNGKISASAAIAFAAGG
jgi:hypothetical protein